jgi:amino acid transporter
MKVGESWIGRGNNALLRGMGTIGVAGVGIACIGLTSSGTLLFSLAPGMWPGMNLAVVIAIGLGAGLILAYLYSAIGAAVRCAGSDYVLTSRVLNGPLAFLSSFVFVVFSGVMGGGLLYRFLLNLQPLFNQIAVMVFGMASSAEVIRAANQPLVIAEVGTVLIVIAFVGMFTTPRIFKRILAVCFLAGLVAWGVIFGILSVNTSNSFIGAWNRSMGMDNFVQVLITAEKMGFAPANNATLIIPAGLFMGLWIFFGFMGTTSLAGEVKNPERDLWRGSWLALVVSGAVFILATLLLQQLVAPDWLSAESFLSNNPAYTGKTTPYITAYAGLLTSSLPLLLLIFWGWAIAFIPLLQTYILFISRIMLAWADDGLLPHGMAYVHPRFRSPLVTMMVAAILLQFGLVLTQFRGFAATPANFSFFAALTMLAPVTAITLFPFLKKSWFAVCPSFVRARVGPLPLVTFFGGIGIVYLIFVLASAFIAQGGMTTVQPGAIIAFGVLLVAGFGLYLGRRMILRKRKIRIEDVFKTLPRTS